MMKLEPGPVLMIIGALLVVISVFLPGAWRRTPQKPPYDTGSSKLMPLTPAEMIAPVPAQLTGDDLHSPNSAVGLDDYAFGMEVPSGVTTKGYANTFITPGIEVPWNSTQGDGNGLPHSPGFPDVGADNMGVGRDGFGLIIPPDDPPKFNLTLGAGALQPKVRKFYITGGRLEDGHWRDDRDTPPMVSYGTDRLDAIANSGVTVWEADEYEAAMKNLKTMPVRK